MTATGISATYSYDYMGNRVQSLDGTGETNYLWDEFSQFRDVLRETDATGAETVRYTLGMSMVLSQTRGADIHFLLPDVQNSTRGLVDDTGLLTDVFGYDAFGEISSRTGTTNANYLYTGQQYDDLTGLYSLRARYYDPNNGRFLARDVWPYDYNNPVELNRYAYTANNPVMFSDPSRYTSMAWRAGVGTVLVTTARLAFSAIPSNVRLNLLLAAFALPSVVQQLAGDTSAPPNEGEQIGIGAIPDDFEYGIGEAAQSYLDQITASNNQNPNDDPDPHLQPRPGVDPLPLPPPFKIPPRTDDDDDNCDPVAFKRWWDLFPNSTVGASGKPLADAYEAGVARGIGTLGTSKEIPTSIVGLNRDQIYMNVDGAEGSTCSLIEAKHASNTANPPWREGGFYRILDQADWELTRLASIVHYPYSPAKKVVIITNSMVSVSYFRSQLPRYSLIEGEDAEVRYVP